MTPGQTIAYAPDAWGRPTQLGTWATGIQYHPNGIPSGFTYGNGLIFSQSLDVRRRPQLQEVKNGAAWIQKLQYGYTNGGDVTAITDQVNGADSVTMTYDSLHRLKSASGLWGSYSYVYDPLNNIRSRSGPNALTYAYNATSNRLTGISGAQSRTYGYNAKGEITGDGTKSFTLNSLGQIQSITGIATYGYDGQGRRIKVTKSGATEYTLYDRAGRLVYTEEGTTKTDYLSVGGHTVVELKKTGTTTTRTYLHPDLLGSPRKATTQAKALLWSEHYDPYGLKLNGVNQKIGYTGHAYDAESGYTYMQARFYDPLVGRFLSTDPIHFVDQNPFTFNRYSYANNNPYRYIDPFGLSSCGTGSHIRGRGGVQCRSSAPGKSNNGETTSAERASVGQGNGGTERHRTLKQLRNDNPLNDYSDRVSRSQRRTGLGDIHADIPKDSLVKTSEQIMEWTVGPFIGVYGGAITLRAGLIIRSAMQQAHVKPLDLAQVIAEITNSFNPNALPPRAMLPNSTPVIEHAVPATPIMVGP